MMIISEGLKAGDLEDLVLPMVSVDEYESKLDDDSIVVAFMVKDRDPAQDLNRFLQKGAVEVLDTDVSPAPNEDGYYLVFVEMLRQDGFPGDLVSILGSLRGLTGIENWRASIYDIMEELDVTEDVLASSVRLSDQPDLEEDLKEFFRLSDLDGLLIEGKTITLAARGVSSKLLIVDAGSAQDVFENNAALAQATRLDESALRSCRTIQRMLGDLWLVEQRGDYLLIRHALRENCALLRTL